MLFQHFEPQGRRFTNFHYYYYYSTVSTTWLNSYTKKYAHIYTVQDVSNHINTTSSTYTQQSKCAEMVFYKPRQKHSLKRCVFRFFSKEGRDEELQHPGTGWSLQQNWLRVIRQLLRIFCVTVTLCEPPGSSWKSCVWPWLRMSDQAAPQNILCDRYFAWSIGQLLKIFCVTVT